MNRNERRAAASQARKTKGIRDDICGSDDPPIFDFSHGCSHLVDAVMGQSNHISAMTGVMPSHPQPHSMTWVIDNADLVLSWHPDANGNIPVELAFNEVIGAELTERDREVEALYLDMSAKHAQYELAARGGRHDA